jgi:hypothetical protein
MRHMKRLILMGVAVVSLGGCAIVPLPVGGGSGRSSSSLSGGGRPACAPSQYWDGQMCRHKGQGSGARKHDG